VVVMLDYSGSRGFEGSEYSKPQALCKARGTVAIFHQPKRLLHEWNPVDNCINHLKYITEIRQYLLIN